jgi:hypothetical protein
VQNMQMGQMAAYSQGQYPPEYSGRMHLPHTTPEAPAGRYRALHFSLAAFALGNLADKTARVPLLGGGVRRRR